ncbi:MAG: glutamate-1-semialdehyde 2,1-aminomutase [Deltaproteobacteria bacterium]|nr:glutamate-1-semialdehyde 2,1-aminomutase [Deltaproteobacteria bacterium]
MAAKRSQDLWGRAQKVIPGGVNSPVRAMRSVGQDPPFIRAGKGCHVEDVDGLRYIDYVGSWGPLILGHAHPDVVAQVIRATEKGTSFGAPTEAEVVFAEELVKWVPSLEMVRLVSSGTEATMSALRLARGFTGRDLIVKFDGCYHGHSDGLLVAAGSGLATLGIPASPGVPAAVAAGTLSLPYNDLAALEEAFAQRGAEIACVIVEPVAGNMGVVLPAEGFLAGLRRLTQEHGALLIFDEVITGFRVARGGAQELYGITPDLTCLGKIIGGGLPLGAYGGRADIMQKIAPAGPVYQAGTLSGNPLATAAGLTVLEHLSAPGVYDRLDKLAERLYQGLDHLFEAKGLAHYGQRVGSMFSFFFQAGPVTDYASAAASDTAMFAKWHRAMLSRGVYLAPSQFEATFVSLAHEEAALDQTLAVAEEALKEL